MTTEFNARRANPASYAAAKAEILEAALRPSIAAASAPLREPSSDPTSAQHNAGGDGPETTSHGPVHGPAPAVAQPVNARTLSREAWLAAREELVPGHRTRF